MGIVLSNFFSEVLFGEESLAHLGKLLFDRHSDSKKFILVDSNTRKFCLPVLVKLLPKNINFTIIEINSGEENKNLKSCEIIWETLTAEGIDKHSVIINLGGGMIGDLGGFSAATILRGVKHIQIPTSLLAMVDASSGGKTGINFAGLKNQVGIFSHPSAICIYPGFLETLPERDFNSGLAEVAKHALIADTALWKVFSGKNQFSANELSHFIKRSIEIKSSYVTLDEKDLKERHALNFGHTIGHAIEAFSLANHKEPIMHGEAVAFGMIAETYLSELVVGLSREQVEEVVNCLAGRYKYLYPDFDSSQLMGFIRLDKKNRNSVPDFTLIPAIGSVLINQQASDENIDQAIRKTKLLFSNSVI